MNRKVILILSIILAVSVIAGLTVYAAVELDGEEKKPELAQTDEWVEREDVPKTITFTPKKTNEDGSDEKEPVSDSSEDGSKTLTYDTSRNLAPDDTVDVYKDENHDEYRFSDGELTGYYNNDTAPWEKKKAEPITEEKAIEIAKKHIEENYDVDLTPYELEVSYNSDYYNVRYVIYFGKDGFISGPKIAVRVHESGEIIYSSNTARLHRGYDTDLLENLTMDELNAYAEKQLRATLEERLISFEIEYCEVKEKDGKIGLALYVAVERTFEGDPGDPDRWTTGMELFYEIKE